MSTKMPSLILVTSFIEKNKLPLTLATLLLKDENDCRDFDEHFHRTNRRIADDLLDFREYKIEKANVTLPEFLERCQNCGGLLCNVFEDVFLQSFNSADMCVILTSLIEKKTSLEELFYNFVENPNKNILQYVI